MKKAWRNPVKHQPASEATLNMTADFDKFRDQMMRIINLNQPTAVTRNPKQTSSAPVPVAS